MPESTRFDDLLSRIGSIIAPGGDTSVLTDPTSREYQVLDWLASSDPANLPIFTTTERILWERYTLVLFYFSAGGESWVNQYKFLSADTICNWNDELAQNKPKGVVCEGSFVTSIVMREC